MKIDEKLHFLCNHPSLTHGFNRATIDVRAYGGFYIVSLKFIKFNENSYDLHFYDSEITVSENTYSKCIDVLYYKVLEQYGGYVDYDYTDTLYNETRLQTYERMKKRLEELIEDTKKDLI